MKKIMRSTFCCLFVFSAILSSDLYAQAVNKDTLLVAAREIISATTYCGLVTIDSTGQPHVRTMNPFPVNDELITSNVLGTILIRTKLSCQFGIPAQ